MFLAQRKIKRAIVILPTYNEIATIAAVLDALIALPLSLDVMVVDDSSPDGTADKVKSHLAFETRLFLLQRPQKLGLASAYKSGFQWALEKGYDVCLEMDSDLSHDPMDVPRLLNIIQEGADIAIGSRYLNGISVINWPLHRLLVSMGAGFYTRLFSRLPLTDPTSGFKAIHRAVIENLDWDKIKTTGYGFQIEVNYFAHRKGFILKEIPIIFTERRDGESKFFFPIVLEAAFRVLQLGLLGIFNGRERKISRPAKTENGPADKDSANPPQS